MMSRFYYPRKPLSGSYQIWTLHWSDIICTLFRLRVDDVFSIFPFFPFFQVVFNFIVFSPRSVPSLGHSWTPISTYNNRPVKPQIDVGDGMIGLIEADGTPFVQMTDSMQERHLIFSDAAQNAERISLSPDGKIKYDLCYITPGNMGVGGGIIDFRK